MEHLWSNIDRGNGIESGFLHREATDCLQGLVRIKLIVIKFNASIPTTQ